MIKVVVLADTHIPKRAKVLPDAVLRAVDAADVAIHAGDWVDVATLDLLESRAGQVIGVFGNNDGPELRARLPLVARATLGNLRIAVVHETGPSKGREGRADRNYPDTDILFFGHSHIPWNSYTPNGLQLLNPGSPTDRRRQPARTFLTAAIKDRRLLDIRLVSID